MFTFERTGRLEYVLLSELHPFPRGRLSVACSFCHLLFTVDDGGTGAYFELF